VWLLVYLWWGFNWAKPRRQPSTRYSFWLTISLLASLHFALQLAVQILYLHHDHEPAWLSIMGFPNKPSLGKVQACFQNRNAATLLEGPIYVNGALLNAYPSAAPWCLSLL
jgi:hypothetical protein